MNLKSISKTVELATQKCKAHGVPITRARVNLFSVLLASDKALSAYELADLYEEAFLKPIPAVTVYRVLDFLQDRYLVHKLETANKFVACSQLDCDHAQLASQFLICNQCLTVKELDMCQEKFEELKEVIEEAGFHLDTRQLEMNCVCTACHTDIVK